MRPFNYDHIAPFYDEMEVNAKLNDIIVLNLQRIFLSRGIRKVWDAACGTGCQAIPLAELGYEVTASDIAGEMIERALGKPGAGQVDFKVADLACCSTKADAVIAMTNVLLHFDEKRISKAFENIAGNIDTEGLFIADFDNRRFIEESGKVVEGYYDSGDGTVNGLKAKRQTKASKIYGGLYCMADRWTAGGEILYETEWDLQSWYMEDIERLLSKAGFRVLNWYDRSFHKVLKEDSISFDSLLFVAEKE